MSIKLPDKSKLAERREKQKAKKEAALSKQEVVRPITLEYLRDQIEELDRMAESLAREAGNAGDSEVWDMSRSIRGEANMCRNLIKHMKSLTHEEYIYQLREGKL